MEIVWSRASQITIRNTYYWYKKNFSIKVAEEILNNILQCSQILSQNPFIGKNFKLWDDCQLDYRKLIIHKNQSLIYHIQDEKIFIDYLLNNRQDNTQKRNK